MSDEIRVYHDPRFGRHSPWVHVLFRDGKQVGPVTRASSREAILEAAHRKAQSIGATVYVVPPVCTRIAIATNRIWARLRGQRQ